MKRLDPDKLSVEYKPGVNPIFPIEPRRYTLTHSDETAELFIGGHFKNISSQHLYSCFSP